MLVLIFGPDNVSSYQKFKDLYECYHLKLIRLIWCYVRDIAIAEDLAQDVYLLCQKKGYRLPLYGYTPDRKYFTIPYQNYIAISIAAQQQTMKLMEQMEERIEELERMMKDGER